MTMKMQPPLSYSNGTSEACANVVSRISLEEVFSPKLDEFSGWLENPMQLELVLLCSLSGFIHFILNRFGIPRFPCQLITGLIFGCSWKHWDSMKLQLFTADSEDALSLYATFGYTLYLFISAVKVNPRMIAKTERKSLVIGIPTLLVPSIGGIFLQSIFKEGLTQIETFRMPFILAFHSMTSFPTISTLLHDLNIVNSKLGRLGLSSALVMDILSILVLTFSAIARKLQEDPAQAIRNLAAVPAVLIVIFLIFKPLVHRMVKQTPKGEPVQRDSIQTVLFMVLTCIMLSSLTGGSTLIAPYIFGLACPDGDPLASTLVNRVEWLVLDIFLPIMVATCALRVDVSKLSTGFDSRYTKLNTIFMFVIAAIKLISCLLSSLYCKLPLKEALTLSIILSCKGLVELVLYSLLFDKQLISQTLFGYLMLVILVFAVVVPLAVRFLYDPSKVYAGRPIRNVMNLNPGFKLQVLACVHGDADIHNTMHLLNISCPREDSPLAVVVFHLIELIGRTTPALISHSRSQKSLDDHHTYSEKMLASFQKFEKDNDGTVSVDCFTAISPNRFVHDDICTLALDKITSLIIMPFHRTWAANGAIDQDDNVIRTLNCSVLERAPCSVAIFADRGHLGHMALTASPEHTCTYSVCMVYLGGNDDREAVSYARRMADDPRVKLTVVRLKSPEEDETSWENILNFEMINYCVGDGTVTYIEEIVMDGTQTTMKVKTLINNYDLIIVGRRYGLASPQTFGLNEWNEFPELGIVGDLITSTDANTRTSVLVIQQQISIHD